MQSLQTVLPRLLKRNCWTELWAKFLKSDEKDVFTNPKLGDGQIMSNPIF